MSDESGVLSARMTSIVAVIGVAIALLSMIGTFANMIKVQQVADLVAVVERIDTVTDQRSDKKHDANRSEAVTKLSARIDALEKAAAAPSADDGDDDAAGDASE
jgi:hypothetical protein